MYMNKREDNNEITKIRRGKRLRGFPAESNIGLQKTEVDYTQIDGRYLRRSGRTVQFATKVTAEFDQNVRQIAHQKGYLIVEVLEEMMDIYLKHLNLYEY